MDIHQWLAWIELQMRLRPQRYLISTDNLVNYGYGWSFIVPSTIENLIFNKWADRLNLKYFYNSKSNELWIMCSTTYAYFTRQELYRPKSRL